MIIIRRNIKPQTSTTPVVESSNTSKVSKDDIAQLGGKISTTRKRNVHRWGHDSIVNRAKETVKVGVSRFQLTQESECNV